jgi:hypothetical protein
MPTRGAGYVERFLAGATVAPPDAHAEMKVERSFNMERKCLVVRGPAVIEGDARPPPRSVGVGLTDAARRKRGAPVTARFSVGDAPPIELTVNDTFETTSKMSLVAPTSSAESARVRIEVASERDVCITLSP